MTGGARTSWAGILVTATCLLAACTNGGSDSSTTATPTSVEQMSPPTSEWGDLTPPRLELDALVPLQPATATGPACPGSDGGRIVFAREVLPPGVDDPDLALWSIVVVNEQGDELAVLADNTHPDVMLVHYPSWSPDGTRIVYYEWREDTGGSLVIVGCDGTEEYRRSNISQRTGSYPLPINTPYLPSWSPDGRLIAFVSPDGAFLVGADLDTPIEKRSQLRPGPHRPSWSPDSSAFVLGLSSDSDEPSLAIVELDGSTRTIGGRELGRFQPAWSPDGDMVAFVMVAEPASVWIMDADGAGLRRLTPSGAFQPSWSPSGAEVVYVSGDVGSAHLRIVGLDGSGDRALTEPGVYEASPQWIR